MSEKVKKQWSKKKKIIVILICIVLFLLVAVLCAGLGVLHWYCTPVDYEIVSASDILQEDTKIIAHRGFRAVAPENTAPAFDEAGKAGFWGNECDIYRTADGVWVVQHDKITYRMMDLTKNIEKCTYDELMQHKTDNGNNIDKYPDLKICTFEEYMDICQQYGMEAVVELKGDSNQEHYDEIIDIISRYDVEVTFISFDITDLEALRKLTDAPMFYLVSKVTQEDIDTAKTVENCGIDFDGNKKFNYENDSEILKKCQEEGLTLGAWTIDDKDTMKQLLDLGVSYITTNCITY